MNLNLKARDWHNWIAVILLIPLLLFGLTSPFLAHKKALDLDKIDLTRFVGWLPGYSITPKAPGAAEIRSSLPLADGGYLIGTQTGLYRLADDKVVAVPDLGATPVRAIAAAPWGVVVAAKNGVWMESSAGWRRTLKGDAWNISLSSDGSVAVALKDRGLLLSRDGTVWSEVPGLAAALAALPAKELVKERVTLGKLMLDLHTGKAFFGKEWEWIWIDLLSAVWVFLGFTGLWLWWKNQTKRRNAARGRMGAGATHD